MNTPYAAMARIPKGRMMTIRALERELRLDRTFEVAAARVRISKSMAKQWAADLGIRKSDLAAETPEARIARLAGWAVALGELGRFDEAKACESDARQLETLLTRLRTRAAEAERSSDAPDPAAELLARIAAGLGADAGPVDALRAVAQYYGELRTLGARVDVDGRVVWPEGRVPDGVPACPAWLPFDPWADADAQQWARQAGDGLACL